MKQYTMTLMKWALLILCKMDFFFERSLTSLLFLCVNESKRPWNKWNIVTCKLFVKKFQWSDDRRERETSYRLREDVCHYICRSKGMNRSQETFLVSCVGWECDTDIEGSKPETGLYSKETLHGILTKTSTN